MDECCKITPIPAKQRGVLITVLCINLLMFCIEAVAGLLAYSTALLADSVDMLGDAIVYGFSLYVIGKGAAWNARSAFIKGLIMAAFGIGVLIQVVFKIVHGITPTAEIMGLIGLLALVGNLFCLMLLWPRRGDDINMRSAWICSRNDVMGNLGVLLGAAAVHLLKSPWPDIIIGLFIAAIFARSAISVIRDASREMELSTSS